MTLVAQKLHAIRIPFHSNEIQSSWAFSSLICFSDRLVTQLHPTHKFLSYHSSTGAAGSHYQQNESFFFDRVEGCQVKLIFVFYIQLLHRKKTKTKQSMLNMDTLVEKKCTLAYF